MNFQHSFARKAFTFALTACASVGFANAAGAQTVVQNATILEAPGGMWVVANASGRASFCQAVLNGSTGNPAGKCNPIGSLGVSSTGFFFTLTGSSLFSINKTSGAIVLCTIVLQNGTNPVGGCAQTSTLATLQ